MSQELTILDFRPSDFCAYNKSSTENEPKNTELWNQTEMHFQAKKTVKRLKK